MRRFTHEGQDGPTACISKHLLKTVFTAKIVRSREPVFLGRSQCCGDTGICAKGGGPGRTAVLRHPGLLMNL